MTSKSRANYGLVKAAVIATASPQLTVEQVATLTGHNLRSVRCAIKHLGLPALRERRPKGTIKDLVLAGHDQGMTVPQLAETSGVSRYTLYATYRRLGITPFVARQGRPTL
jgi:transcriptional regulator of acetoin/glycerol metabolism